jgi:hypothetical protein
MLLRMLLRLLCLPCPLCLLSFQLAACCCYGSLH